MLDNSCMQKYSKSCPITYTFIIHDSHFVFIMEISVNLKLRTLKRGKFSYFYALVESIQKSELAHNGFCSFQD